MDGILDQAAKLLSVDTSFVSEIGVRGVTAAFTEVAPILKDVQDNINAQPPNYYHGCQSLVQLAQFATDQNVNN